MKIVWRHEDGVTVRDVYEELRTQRAVAYTTVMSSLKTLEQKGHLTTTQQDRAYLYRPARPKQQVIKDMVRDFVNRVFNGASQPLVLHLLEDEQMTELELREISRMAGKKR
jgi:predicted transcriptional regulator